MTARRLLAAAGLILALALAAAAAAGLWLHGRIEASLPVLDGAVRAPGLGSPVRVQRDSLGVVTVTGASRQDVARATGWLHAQDRFFQMDILRRRGAGELAELFGKPAIGLDREARMHGFRQLARRALALESPAHRALVEAYAQGVNEGLASLRATPWEYAILRMEPRAWEPEDCLLVTYAMTLDLQEPTGRYVRSLAAIRDALGPASLAFFAPLSTADDAALDSSSAAPAPIPPASEVDLRKAGEAPAVASAREGDPWGEAGTPGSNSIAVAGALAGGGPALLANDMHLHLGVPNIWYRVTLRWPGHDETGVTLPGNPGLVAGSTGRIAWGFTNSYAGTSDVIRVDPGPAPELYHGPKGTGLSQFEVRRETVAVRGSSPVSMEFRWSVWGPVVAEAPEGRWFVLHWTEDDPAATNLGLFDIEEAKDARGAVEIAHTMGIPAQNFLVADSSGAVAWTIAGFLPRRVGYDGRLPAKWSFGDRRWDGYLAPGEIPAIVSPAPGYLWTANNRTVGGKSLELLGDAGYDIAARARQIRDDVAALARSGRPVGPADLLSVQLDDRALLLEPWHALLLATLSPRALSGQPARAALLEAARRWEGRADPASSSYRIVRAFRLAASRRILDPIFAPCVAICADFSWARLNCEDTVLELAAKRPANLLDRSYGTWDDLFLAAADEVSRSLASDGLKPADATWGRRNTARIEHPFARSLPRWASLWLRMPEEPLPGDSNMPRVQQPSFGASERFDVAPGREAQGIFHMPGGQCANLLSPYFRAGHEAWVRGDPTPFLPGPMQHSLELEP
jgi:penicillin amidase